MIGWIYGVLGLLIGGSVIGGTTYIAMLSREQVVIRGVVKAERSACDARVAGVAAEHNRNVEDGRLRAEEAAAGVGPSPSDKASLARLCKADANCRDRGRTP